MISFIYLLLQSHVKFALLGLAKHELMDSANQIQSLVDQVEKSPEYKISEQEAKGFLSEMKRITREDKTNMPPLVVIIMAYINMLFPELDEGRA